MPEEDSEVSVSGVLERLIFQSPNFSVAIFKTRDAVPDEVRNAGSSSSGGDSTCRFKAKGSSLPQEKGPEYTLLGAWQPDSRDEGNQIFNVTAWTPRLAAGKEETVKLLSSSQVRGVGKKTAEKVWDCFGEDTLSVLAGTPERLEEVPGLTKEQRSSLENSFCSGQPLNALILLLHPCGVPFRVINAACRLFGEDAVQLVRADPYLLQLCGFSFAKADRTAEKMGFSRNDPVRIRAAVREAQQSEGNRWGHMYLPQKELVYATLEVLNRDAEKDQLVTYDEVRGNIAGLLQEGALTCLTAGEEQRIYPAYSLLCEDTVAKAAASRIGALQPDGDWHERCLETVRDIQEEYSIQLNELQEKAVLTALESSISIITGGPGTGKTTALMVLVRAVRALFRCSPDQSPVLLAAPTGRAARRMSEQTGNEASTIHSLLGITPDTRTDFTKERKVDLSDDESPLEQASMLIVDEASMVDAHLMAELMWALPSSTRLVLVGDADQLPSVGAGNVLAQLLSVKAIPRVRLEHVLRQRADSAIPLNAALVRQGVTELKYDRSFQLIPCANEEEGAALIAAKLKSVSDPSVLEEVQILTPLRARGPCSAQSLNHTLRDIINPAAPGKREIHSGRALLREGDRVMQTVNTKSASNGDIGTVESITPVPDNDRTVLKVRFPDRPEPAAYSAEALEDLEHAYAVTIHKSQGGEFSFVIIPLFDSAGGFLQRNLIYTAITRAKKQVLLVGQKRVLEAAIRRTDNSRRNSSLAELTEMYCRTPPGEQQKPE